MRTILNLTFCLLVANALFANPTVDTVSHQRAFSHAKQQINAMLSGDKQLSFEEAIYQLENAWYAGGIDYVSFKTNLDFHTQNIRSLINSINSPLTGASADVAIPRHLADKRNNNLLANYAIYTYLTQHSLWIHDSTITIQQPVQYSAEDPMGTTDWANSHITHLLNEGTGNCFAMAALFKIFADRLGTDAQLCTAPGHIYIRHADENGTEYNVELAGRKFPGTGSIEAITYTTPLAVKNGIAMRALNDTQAVALTMVYLAKARQYSMGLVDGFTADCAQTALSHDPNNLNAMLLKAETMEEELLATIAGEDIQTHPLFAAYQQWLQHIYSLGYRELPQDMKEKLVNGWGKKSTGTEPVLSEEDDTRYASLSWGLFDEQVKNKQVEQYGRTLFNTATQTITGFTTTPSAYNQYTYDPVIFAWEMDPLAHKMPGWSPYSVLYNNPITFIDPLGNTASDPKEYKVKKGETLSGIAAKVGMSTSALASLNNLSDPNRIKAGQVLQVNPEVDFSNNPYTRYNNPFNATGVEVSVDHPFDVALDFALGTGYENSLIVSGKTLDQVKNLAVVQNFIADGWQELNKDGKLTPGEVYNADHAIGSIGGDNFNRIIASSIFDLFNITKGIGDNTFFQAENVLGSFSFTMRVNSAGNITISVCDHKRIQSLSDNNIRNANLPRQPDMVLIPGLEPMNFANWGTTTYQRYIWDIFIINKPKE